jgi:hypothetical protein
MNVAIIILFILLVGILLCAYKWKKMEFYTNKNETPMIDVVITWVDGNQKKFVEEVNTYGKKYQLDRFYQNQELKYCLRSIELNMTFIRKIFIVIREDHYPDFLKSNHYQLEFITHPMIIPSRFLPTFNSIVIENFIHKIPGLSEHFIYFNDDMIVLKETKVSDFFDYNFNPIQSKDENKIITLTTSYNFWTKNKKSIVEPLKPDNFNRPFALKELIDHNNEIIDLVFQKETRYRSQHIPYSCRKSFMNQLDEFLKSLKLTDKTMYEHSGIYKFRDLKSIARFSLFKKYWDIYMNDCLEKEFSLLSIIINDKVDKTKEIQALDDPKFQFFVIHNEVQEMNEIAKKNFLEVNNKLDKLFPFKSTFEI